MKKYLIGKTRMFSLFCAGCVGFCIGSGLSSLGILCFILAVVLDFLNKVLIEQNKNTVDTRSGSRDDMSERSG